MFERGVPVFAADYITSCNILVLNVYYTDKHTTNTTLSSMPVLRLSYDQQDSAKTDNDRRPVVSAARALKIPLFPMRRFFDAYAKSSPASQPPSNSSISCIVISLFRP